MHHNDSLCLLKAEEGTVEEKTEQERICMEKYFESLYFQYYKLVFSIAIRFLKDKQLAEDAVQDVFVRLWNNRSSLDENKNIKALVATITRNCLLNMVRKHKNEIKKIAAASEQQTLVNEEDTAFKVDWKSNIQLLDECLQTMPPRKREIFSLKIFGKLSNEEIAHQLGLSINTVKFQYTEAKNRIEENLKRF